MQEYPLHIGEFILCSLRLSEANSVSKNMQGHFFLPITNFLNRVFPCVFNKSKGFTATQNQI